RPYLSRADQARIHQAFTFAASAHRGAKRASGETFLIHPTKVALTLAKMELDADTIVAGLLNDVVEDTGISSQELQRTYGPDVAALVAGVTKLAEVQLKARPSFLPAFFKRRAEEQLQFERQVESLRKMLL